MQEQQNERKEKLSKQIQDAISYGKRIGSLLTKHYFFIFLLDTTQEQQKSGLATKSVEKVQVFLCHRPAA